MWRCLFSAGHCSELFRPQISQIIPEVLEQTSVEISGSEIFWWLDPEPLAHFPEALTLLRRIQLRFLWILRPKKHVAVIALRHRDKLAQLFFVPLAQFQDRELHPLAFPLVRFNAVSVEQLDH